MGARIFKYLITFWLGLLASGCGRAAVGMNGGPQIDENGFEHARRLGPEQVPTQGPSQSPYGWDASPGQPVGSNGAAKKAGAKTPTFSDDEGKQTTASKTPAANGATRLELNEAMNLRFEKAGRLEFLVELAPGSVIEVPAHYAVNALPFRDSHGNIRTSSTGFLTPVKIVSVPKTSELGSGQLTSLNATAGGLYVFASILGNVEGVKGSFAPLKILPAGFEYLKLFEESGRPRFDFERRLEKKFGPRVNHASAGPSSQAAQEKWKRVYAELVRVASREVQTPRSLLMITNAEAAKWSKELESSGQSPSNGAWTIAVTATAIRHGFSNVPCAEFASEVIREAYVRSGVKFNDDFNHSRKNELIWYGTADVQGLTRALSRAGWVPWSTARFQAPVGAIMMNGLGESPGHAFIAAGAHGRFIIDNGSPQGRDLGITGEHSLANMYSAAVFFLPPGIQPAHW